MFSAQKIKKSAGVAVWFMFLTFPIMVIRVNTIDKVIEWRWSRLWMVGAGSFVISLLWDYLLQRRQTKIKPFADGDPSNPAQSRLPG